jgi:hypothetical protein
MATGAPPATYVWELGIDWDEVLVENGRYYLQDGFVLGDSMAPLRTSVGDTIIFKIFDVTPRPDDEPVHLRSFCILPKPAVSDDPPTGDPFSHLQPDLPPRRSERLAKSVAFGGSDRPFPVWEFPPVLVTTPGRFLLSFLVQAWSPREKSTSRLYGVDPEMVVGPNTGSE